MKNFKAFLFPVLFFLAGITFAASTNFIDVSDDDWFADAIDFASENEIMTGYDDGRFGPNDPVNRAQLATVLERINADQIGRMYGELNALRLHDKKQLTGSSWSEYKQAVFRFPVFGVEGREEGFVGDYERNKDQASILATDSEGWRVLDVGLTDVFYMQVYNALHGGEDTYGPFTDDVERIVSEANEN